MCGPQALWPTLVSSHLRRPILGVLRSRLEKTLLPGGLLGPELRANRAWKGQMERPRHVSGWPSRGTSVVLVRPGPGPGPSVPGLKVF
jgi:hypothetical protein